MAIQTTSMKLTICALFLLLTVCAKRTFAATYTVGDTDGWGPDNDYGAWTRGKTFHKGDVLVFQYEEGYTVQEVSSSKEYSDCDGRKALFEGSDGNTSIPLKKSGTHFFICSDFDVCAAGMNMTIQVTN